MSTPRTRPWRSEELIHERYYYHAARGAIESVYFPGCGAFAVDQQAGGWLILENARVLRAPQRVRNAGEYV